MYRLFLRIVKGLDPVADVFKKHVEGEGMKLVREVTEAADAKKEKDVGARALHATLALVSASSAACRRRATGSHRGRAGCRAWMRAELSATSVQMLVRHAACLKNNAVWAWLVSSNTLLARRQAEPGFRERARAAVCARGHRPARQVPAGGAPACARPSRTSAVLHAVH